jgi:Type IV secretion-system coupling protein DNA-binding domain
MSATTILSTSTEVDPLAYAGMLFHDLIEIALTCCAGAALGAVAARLMYTRGMRWTWALCACVAVVLLRSQLSATFLPALCATLVASRRLRRWQRQDRDAGLDVPNVRGGRSWAIDLLREATRRRAEARDGAPSLRGDGSQELLLGYNARSRAVHVPLGSHSGHHTLVVGTTGSGKTVTQTRIACAAIARGMGAVVIDPKGDVAMRRHLRDTCCATGRRFVEWTPHGDCVYNAFARGSDTEIADKALGGERFTEPHYLRQAQRYLGHALRAMRAAGEPVSLATLVDCLNPERLELLARELPECEAERTQAYLDSLGTRQRSDLSGVRDRLAVMAESDVGPWLDPRTPSTEQLDLLGAIHERAVVLLSLEADVRPLLAQMLAAAVVGDLLSAVAALQSDPVPTLVVIDEFSALGADQVVRLFGRARSAGVSLVLGTQELSDLRLPGRERLLEQVLGNVSTLIAHQQVVPSSAEMISAVAGRRPSWRVSRHSDGRTTRTSSDEPLLPVECVMALERGTAAVVVPGARVAPQVAHVLAVGHE